MLLRQYAAFSLTVSSTANAHFEPATEVACLQGYPYPRPASSFCFVGGETWLFEDASWQGVENLLDLSVQLPAGRLSTSSLTLAPASVMQALEAAGIDCGSFPPPQDWTPVLGIGSNGSPEQLARKYPPSKFPQAVIPVVRCALKDFDVCYAPLIASYGSVTGAPRNCDCNCPGHHEETINRFQSV